MGTVEIRRARLKKWFEGRALPEDEKSYLSQLINGKSSFGEKAARRLEKTYGMPTMYLDAALDTPMSDTVADDGWLGLSAKRRELIRRIASQDLSDGMIDALQVVIDQASPPPPPRRPATAVTGGPPRNKEKAKKTSLVGAKK